MTAANILTIIRLILTPVFVVLFISKEYSWAILTFSVAAFTDLIDGTVARLLRQYSVKGALLDPLADKLLVQSCFLCLFVAGVLPFWFFLLALARDMMIVSGIFYLEHLRCKLPYRATWSSKFATFFQLGVAIIGLLLWWQQSIAIGVYSLGHFFLAFLIVAAFLLVVSGVQYVLIGSKILSDEKSHASAGAGQG